MGQKVPTSCIWGKQRYEGPGVCRSGGGQLIQATAAQCAVRLQSALHGVMRPVGLKARSGLGLGLGQPQTEPRLCLWQAHEQAQAKRILFRALVHVLFNQMTLQAAQNLGQVRNLGGVNTRGTP